MQALKIAAWANLIAILVAVGALSSQALAQVPTAEQTKENLAALKVLTIERQPFAMLEKGKLSGFSIDLWKQVAKEIGASFQMELTSHLRGC
jgi:polar amino acid transport system substrate-binding protein